MTTEITDNAELTRFGNFIVDIAIEREGMVRVEGNVGVPTLAAASRAVAARLADGGRFIQALVFEVVDGQSAKVATIDDRGAVLRSIAHTSSIATGGITNVMIAAGSPERRDAEMQRALDDARLKVTSCIAFGPSMRPLDRAATNRRHAHNYLVEAVGGLNESVDDFDHAGRLGGPMLDLALSDIRKRAKALHEEALEVLRAFQEEPRA